MAEEEIAWEGKARNGSSRTRFAFMLMIKVSFPSLERKIKSFGAHDQRQFSLGGSNDLMWSDCEEEEKI